jgi:hypothetical protein
MAGPYRPGPSRRHPRRHLHRPQTRPSPRPRPHPPLPTQRQTTRPAPTKPNLTVRDDPRHHCQTCRATKHRSQRVRRTNNERRSQFPSLRDLTIRVRRTQVIASRQAAFSRRPGGGLGLDQQVHPVASPAQPHIRLVPDGRAPRWAWRNTRLRSGRGPARGSARPWPTCSLRFDEGPLEAGRGAGTSAPGGQGRRADATSDVSPG